MSDAPAGLEQILPWMKSVVGDSASGMPPAPNLGGMADLPAGGIPGMGFPGAPAADDIDQQAGEYYKTRMARKVIATGHFIKVHDLMNEQEAAAYGQLYMALHLQMQAKTTELLQATRTIVNHPGQPLQVIAFTEWMTYTLEKIDHSPESNQSPDPESADHASE